MNSKLKILIKSPWEKLGEPIWSPSPEAQSKIIGE